jgi:hypothetical protein
MNVAMLVGFGSLLALVGILLVGFQIKERLEKIASLLDKK